MSPRRGTETPTPVAPGRTRLSPAAPDGGRGTKDDGRQAVLSALSPASHSTSQTHRNPDDPTPARPGIRIYAPPVYRSPYDGARWSKRHGDTPTAAYACPCGQAGTARGRDAVAALVAEYDAHKHACTGTLHTERRNAA
ncbi:hypothetical protein AB0I00_27820 [Streptomyces sp. NPDC050803]|uniref:hypothetical protein n=1 Tax=unclassified Streptomyces TaxID=2593676 RepID=UPI003438F6E3